MMSTGSQSHPDPVTVPDRVASLVLNSLPDPIFVFDDRQRLAYMNPPAEALFQKSLAETFGQTLREVIPAEELSALVMDTTRSLNEWVTEDERVFVPRVLTLAGEGGTVDTRILTLRDITQFRKLNRNQAEFTRIVSHDLRSPLTSMQGFANMLQLGLVGELNEKQLHFINKILAGINQMTALVDNIQDAGRYDPETGFYELSRSPCDLNELVRKVVENHLVPAEKDLNIQVSVEDSVPIINADPNMLERAIINLVDNAVKYTPSGGTVEVLVQRVDSQVLIKVRDTGPGISPDNQKRLFERHVRLARQEHKKIKGSGLGLFIVRSVAQRHGGRAWVESQEGVGSTFYLAIPLEGANLIGQ